MNGEFDSQRVAYWIRLEVACARDLDEAYLRVQEHLNALPHSAERVEAWKVADMLLRRSFVDDEEAGR